MDVVAASDEAKDGMGIDIVFEGEALGEEDGLQSENMAPGGFVVEEFCEQDHAGEVVEGCDEVPFLSGIGGPKVERGIMLNKFPGILGDDFTVMGGAFRFGQIKALLLGTVNDRGQGNHLLIVCL